jgi:predicted outer membrane protein
MKLSTSAALLIIVTSFNALLVSCSTDKRSGTYSAAITPEARHAAISNEDMKFLFEAENMCIYNKHVAREALIRSTAIESSAIAQEMIASSERISQAIAKVAEEYTINLPSDITEEQKTSWRTLVKQKGWNFDKKFFEITEQHTNKAQAFYTLALNTCKDEAVKTIAQQGLAELKARQDLLAAQQGKMIERIGDTDSSFIDMKVTASLALDKHKK